MATPQTSTPMGDDEQQGEALSPNIGESNPGNTNDVPMNDDSTQVETDNSLPTVGSRRLISDVWKHFKRRKIDGKLKAICNYCDKPLLGDTKQGTSHLRNHFKGCKLRTTRDIRQSFIKTEKVGSETVVVGNYVFNQETARRALRRMIILHEYPMSIVDHIGFKEFCAALQPLFKVVSRNTIKSDIMKEYKEAQEHTMKVLSSIQSRVAITTDMWTATHQNKGYMTVTAHFIDDSWTLQSRLVRFIYVSAPHTSQVLAEVLVQCLMDWNLDRKISTLTVDNCTTNDAMLERIVDKISPRSLILGGQLFHMRCCAHILNLIVKDGLSIIANAIEKIRESVSFWTATPKREEKFIETCAHVNIPFSRKLVLDCKTRWNSTFLMLQVAIQYKDVFDRLSQRESQYKALPCEYDWQMANEICQKLEIFYDVTLLFSGTSYPTANIFFPKVCQIKLALMEWLESPISVIHQMAASMISKFDKYWGVINGVMAVGIVLDPRYKIDLLDYFFPQIYGVESDFEIQRVKSICQDLVKEYEMKIKGKKSVYSTQSSNPNIVERDLGRNDSWRKDFAKHQIAKKSEPLNYKSELDCYLEEQTLPDSDEEFDILTWWKANGLKYPILQMVARDFLAIPISTVASESSFSTGGRFLTPHRSRLHPDTLEALMCVQDWLWTDIKGSLRLKMDKMSLNTVIEELVDENETSDKIEVIDEGTINN